MRKIVIGVLAATLLAAACGGSSNKSGSSTNGSTTTSTKGGGSSGGDEFSQLTAKAKTADLKITFTGEDGKSTTYAQDGTGKTAYVSGDSVSIYDGTNSISCSGTGTDASCTQIPGASASAASALVTGLLPLYAGINSSLYGGHVSSDTIAGRDARCVAFKASDYAPLAALAGKDGFDSTASVAICADKETGFLLKLVTTSAGTDKNIFLATAVDKSSASDFTPPATPKTIPSFTVPSFTVPNGVSVP